MKQLAIILVGLACAAAYVVFDMTRTPSVYQPAEITDQQALEIVPNPTFTSLDGQSYQLHDFKGKIIILNFWATWCAPCKVEFPDLLEIAHKRSDDVVLVALSVDNSIAPIQPFLDRLPKAVRSYAKASNVIIAHDPKKLISLDMFQTVKYPETYVIAPDLTIERKIVGALTPDHIQALLNP